MSLKVCATVALWVPLVERIAREDVVCVQLRVMQMNWAWRSVSLVQAGVHRLGWEVAVNGAAIFRNGFDAVFSTG